MCKVSFLTTLDIYKTYFKGHHTRRTYANSDLVPYSLWKKILRLCTLGFCNQVLLDLHCRWSEELCSQQHLLQVVGVSHVLGFVHHWWRSYTWEVGSSDVSSSTKIVEYRDKNFVLDLKLFFIIVNYFSRRFPPMLFTMKLVCFVGFPRSSYLFLFTFPLCMILTWYWCLFVLTRFIHNKSN